MEHACEMLIQVQRLDLYGQKRGKSACMGPDDGPVRALSQTGGSLLRSGDSHPDDGWARSGRFGTSVPGELLLRASPDGASHGAARRNEAGNLQAPV